MLLKSQTYELQSAHGTPSVALVTGTGVGCGGFAGPGELGKAGLNAGTDFENGDFPQVPPYDFIAGRSVRENFVSMLGCDLKQLSVREIAALSRVDPCDASSLDQLDLRILTSSRRCAEQSLIAMARVLADTCYLLSDHFGTERVYVGGGIAQGLTRDFLVSEIEKRGEKIGIIPIYQDESLQLEIAGPMARFCDSLADATRSTATPGQFMSAAIKHALDYFAVCDNVESRKALRRYVPYFAIDAIMEEYIGKKSQIRIGAAGEVFFHINVPTDPDVTNADLEFVACAAHCNLLSRAVMPGYVGSSNFEGHELKNTLTSAGVGDRIIETYLKVYKRQGFATLTERYRELVARQQAASPPIGIEDLERVIVHIEKVDGAKLLTIDIGAESVKAGTWKVEDGRVKLLEKTEPFATPGISAGDAAALVDRIQMFFDRVIDKSGNLESARDVDAIAVTWPGPVTRSHPAEFSGVFRKIAGLPTKIAETEPGHLQKIEITSRIQRAWKNKRFAQGRATPPVTLMNDGTAFGAFYMRRERIADADLEVRYHGMGGAALVGILPLVELATTT